MAVVVCPVSALWILKGCPGPDSTGAPLQDPRARKYGIAMPIFGRYRGLVDSRQRATAHRSVKKQKDPT